MLLNLLEKNLSGQMQYIYNEHITRNLTNFKEVELKDSISKLDDGGILLIKIVN